MDGKGLIELASEYWIIKALGIGFAYYGTRILSAFFFAPNFPVSAQGLLAVAYSVPPFFGSLALFWLDRRVQSRLSRKTQDTAKAIPAL
jgi:hypothetical protein